ncbi:MAG TPA: glycosyltransferase family 4 protein [Jatrophihabitans sp.]|nr:glycosyltransferase family 4 protein [Jatrophihabitans sp.]
MRFYLAWQYLTGYSTSGMHALVEQGHDVRLMYQEALVHPPFLAPFDDAELTKGLEAIGWSGKPDEELLMRQLDEFRPDVLVVNSWHIAAYMKAARRWRDRALRIVVMDHQWLGTPKQWLGRLTRQLYIQPAFDAAFMPGDEQAVFARHLGFAQHEIIVGLYTCEDAFFTGPQDPPRDSFLFTGRLVDTKGVDVLARAYRAYREQTADPWPLVVAGIGPMDAELGAIEGVQLRGFVAPQDLPAVMAEAGCLVLPSRFEPWGVVVQEAAASGQAVICTNACGAASRLVLDGYNGRVVAPGRPDELAQALHWIADADAEHRAAVSRRSVELAKQYTPQRWAEHLVDRCRELLP